MKKLLLAGCIIIGGICVILVIAAVVLFMTFSGAIKNVQTTFENYQKLEETYPFEKPTTEIMTEQRFNQYMDARRQVGLAMRERFQQLQDFSSNAEQGNVSIWEGLSFVGQMAGSVPEVMKAHQAALEQAEMAPSEYGWHTRITLSTLFLASAQNNPDAQRLRETFQQKFQETMKGVSSNQPNDLTPEEQFRRLQKRIEKLGYRYHEENWNLIKDHKDEITSPPVVLFIDMLTLDELAPANTEEAGNTGGGAMEPTPAAI